VGGRTRGPDPFGIVRAPAPTLSTRLADMNKDENVRQAVLELIASDPDGDWDIASLCARIYGHSDARKYYVIRRVIRDMKLPGTWRLGWRKKSTRLYDPCSDARLADLEKRIEQLEKKGWHDNAKACRRELEKLRALKGLPPKDP
jgi:hypothetical protein